MEREASQEVNKEVNKEIKSKKRTCREWDKTFDKKEYANVECYDFEAKINFEKEEKMGMQIPVVFIYPKEKEIEKRNIIIDIINGFFSSHPWIRSVTKITILYSNTIKVSNIGLGKEKILYISITENIKEESSKKRILECLSRKFI